ncbi:MAG TPA: DUF1376 domain-containing protein [Thauera sp.]|nr:DUF1376 domain-containing protein [Thauera sp.]
MPALIAETQHLDPEAFGCLMRLMHAYWQSGPAKDDDRVLARLVGLSPDEWGGIRPDVEPFFDILHGQWLHWRLDEELEAAYDAINRNAARTKAATAARKAKRNDERDVVRNDEHDVENLCNQRDVVRNEHPIGSIHTPHAAAAGTPQARAKAKQVSGDFEGDVRAAERDLGIGGEV